ncbi:MAG: hypothetical protein ACFE7A_03750 [Promethearchaeota archaeon]
MIKMGGNKSHKHIKNIRNGLVLGDLTGKVSNDSKIAQSEKALVNVESGALYFPVLLDETIAGGIFLGSGHFIVDAIIETGAGAVGKSEEHKWDGNLLLLDQGGMWSAPNTEPFKHTDLKIHNLESAEKARERAQKVLNRFSFEGRSWASDFFESKKEGWIVNIIDKENKESRLVAKRDRLVMTHEGIKLVIKGNKLVRKGNKKILVVGEEGNIVRVG